MTWYWQREGDALVIREEREYDGEGEYVAEIDVRYLTPADRERAEAIADGIVQMENNARRLEANAAAYEKAKENRG